MNCHQAEINDCAERYLAGRLSEPEREEWELHYFSCATCFARLEAIRAAKEALIRYPPRRPILRVGIFAAAGLAAVVLIAVAVRSSPPPPPTPPPQAAASPSPARERLLALARIDPPRYSPVRLRGAASASESGFREAMIPYQRGNYREAELALEQTLRLHPDNTDARFFLGALHLMQGRGADARGLLETFIADSDSPYQEEAGFYFAKACLLQGDLAQARRWLEQTARLGGEWKGPAAQLLAELDPLR